MTRTEDHLSESQLHRFQRRLSSLERASQRVASRCALWARYEERFALFRLLSAALLVMLLAGFYKRMDASQVFLGWLSFLIIFFIFSAFHNRLKRVRSRCEGMAGVFAHEILRHTRNWDGLRKYRTERQTQVWQKELLLDLDHPYRSDLDLLGLVPLWLETCTLQEGTRMLAREVRIRGTEPLSNAALSARKERVNALASESKALRRWESYRIGALAKELQVENRAVEQEIAGDDAQGAMKDKSIQRSGLEILLWGVVFAQVTYWFVYFLPAVIMFLNTADAAALSQPLTLFLPILILGAMLWESWRRKIQGTSGVLGLRELRVLTALEDVARCVPGSKSLRALVPVAAGRRFRFLRATFELGEVRRNPIVWLLLNILFPYDALTFSVTLLANRFIDGRFEQWWSDVVDFDFHAALARVKLENPEFVWSQLSQGGMAAQALAHPLLPLSNRVGNDLILDQGQRCLLLTGSNMAGKSTLLRALGMNVLLAQLGTPVCAGEFQCPKVEVLCAIQVTDSLESGASYFYAEVKRLAALLQRLRLPPSSDSQRLFLIDEIFRGTNNRERFLGSWQVISALLSTGAFGLLTTHDLALTSLERTVAGVRNFHLRETVSEQGVLEFDYLLRSGPCPTTNALIIMKQAGLPVELNFSPEV